MPTEPANPSPEQPSESPKRVFRRRHRLSGGPAFRKVFDGKLRRARGPLTVFFVPNDLPEPRLGLSVGRKVGSAPVRARCKRLIREAFRLERAHLPTTGTGSYDLVVAVRPGAVLTLEQCRQTLRQLASEAHELALKRRRKADPGAGRDG